MQVETYEVVESTEGEPENEAAAVELIDQLALAGQQKLICAAGKALVRNPYRVMSIEEVNVYGNLLMSHEKLAEYDSGPIPLRVLQVAAHAKSLNFFETFEVWRSGSKDLKDPVLIGKTKGYDGDRYLLARWGEELEPFSVLAKKAVKIMRGKLASALQGIKVKVDARIASLKDKPDETILAERFSEPSVYGVGD